MELIDEAVNYAGMEILPAPAALLMVFIIVLPLLNPPTRYIAPQADIDS